MTLVFRNPSLTFAPDDAPMTLVEAFRLATRQVTAFLHARPEWRRDRVARLQADEGYLTHWSGPDR